MIIGEEIIKMFGKRIGKVQKANALMAGECLVTGGFFERRKFVRFKARSGAFASIQFDHFMIGPLQNISEGGLAFRYISEGSQISISLEVDICVGGKDFHIMKIPSKIISDFNIDKQSLHNALTIRQCGVQFCELTEDQISCLDDFIKGSTLGVV